MKKSNLLKLDIDFKPPNKWMKLWREERAFMLHALGYHIKNVLVVPSSKRGIHVYIRLLEEVPPQTLNMLQWLCGDDPSRVEINRWRIKTGIENWNVLFYKVIYRKDGGYIVCHYCNNKIPLGIIKKQLEEAEKK
jgi:hypothetical protein